MNKILLIGEKHPSHLRYYSSEESTLKLVQSLTTDVRKHIEKNYRYRIVGVFFPRMVEKKFHEKIKKQINEYINIYKEKTKKFQKIADVISEYQCELFKKYNPDAIFLEVDEKREDIKKLSKWKKYTDFQPSNKNYSIFCHLDRAEYEKELINKLITFSNLNSKTLAIIGANHLKPAKLALEKEGFDVDSIFLR